MRGLKHRDAAELLKVTQLVSGRAVFEQSFLMPEFNDFWYCHSFACLEWGSREKREGLYLKFWARSWLVDSFTKWGGLV